MRQGMASPASSPRRGGCPRPPWRRRPRHERSGRRRHERHRSPASRATPAVHATPLLAVEKLRKHYLSPKPWIGKARPPIQAVDDVSFSVERGETLALVGESGCGKTTTAKSVVRLVEPTSGSIRLEGEELTTLSPESMRPARKDLQIVFQDPYASLDPRMPPARSSPSR
jgi:ABC-type glutathione transport system ATPase component